LNEEAVVALLARRETRRAYNGAPPKVPHPIDQHQSASCLACHGVSTRVGTIDVPQMSHAPYSQCIQCHAPQHGPGPQLAKPPPARATPALANHFVGLSAPVSGTRAYTGAPPTVPHPTHMRQNCVSCHGPGGSSALKTTHPQRQNCFQCHALDAARETLPPASPTALR
jgi:cytochrome c-type protein NapB